MKISCENANPMIRSISILLAVVAWTLTIVLVYNLLDGTFESGRTCQTDCVQTLYGAAILIALGGTLFSFLTRSKGGCIGLLPSAILVAMFVATMFIGTFL